MSAQLPKFKSSDRPDRSRPYPGQPYAIPRSQKVMHKGSGTTMVKFVYPRDVIKVRSPDDLAHMLYHYNHPIPMIDESGNHERTPHGMRYLLEWVYPALRWYCRIYDHPVPPWLDGLGFATNVKGDGFKKLFGSDKPLDVREFKVDKKRGVAN